MNKKYSDINIDATREIINMGVGEAAFSLSELVHQRVIIDVSDIKFLDKSDLKNELAKLSGDNGIQITQAFKGGINGLSMLLYSNEFSKLLMKLLLGIEKNIEDYETVDLSAAEELGNIILGSCVSKISDVIDVPLWFSLPKVKTYFDKEKGLVIDTKLVNCIMAKNTLTIGKVKISGYIFILLEFENLIEIIDKITKNYLKKLGN